MYWQYKQLCTYIQGFWDFSVRLSLLGISKFIWQQKVHNPPLKLSQINSLIRYTLSKATVGNLFCQRRSIIIQQSSPSVWIACSFFSNSMLTLKLPTIGLWRLCSQRNASAWLLFSASELRAFLTQTRESLWPQGHHQNWSPCCLCLQTTSALCSWSASEKLIGWHTVWLDLSHLDDYPVYRAKTELEHWQCQRISDRQLKWTWNENS